MYSCLGSRLSGASRDAKTGKAWFVRLARPGSAPPSRSRRPATEVRAPEPTPVAPHERERRSTPPIPAPRVSWRLLLLTSSDTDTYIASESATAIFRFVFFLPACAVRFRLNATCRLRKGKSEFVSTKRQWIELIEMRIILKVIRSNEERRGTFREGTAMLKMPHTRARARERSRRPTEHLRNRRFVCQTLAGTYGRAFSGPRRPRVDARAYHRRDSRSRATTIRGDALSSSRRSSVPGRWPPTGAI